MKRLAVITILIFCLFFCACSAENSTEPAPAPVTEETAPPVIEDTTEDETEDDTTADTSEMITSTEEESFSVSEADWNVYKLARSLTDSINSRQYHTMVYTRITDEESVSSQTINMTVAYEGIDTDSPVILSSGTIKAEDRMMDLQVYYADGIMYSESGSSKETEEIDFFSAISSVDVLWDLRTSLDISSIRSISYEYSADGSKLVDFEFRVTINGMSTEGTGEVLIDGTGFITSESYSLSAVNGSQQISQSAEVTLLSYGDEMEPIEAPDLTGY